jgi:glutamate decarboxylase
MVHLSGVPTDKQVNEINDLVPGMSKISFAEADEDTFNSSVYGSKFAGQDLPKHEMPENEMPKEIAYRMIKDDLTLDGTPTLKYALLWPNN